MTTFALVFFALEIFLSALSNAKYRFSFFFWLDLIQTASLIFDIGWVLDARIFKQIGAKTVVQSSRAARLTRVLRILRVMRITRVVKLYKQARVNEEQALRKKEEEIQIMNINKDHNREPIVKQGRPSIRIPDIGASRGVLAATNTSQPITSVIQQIAQLSKQGSLQKLFNKIASPKNNQLQIIPQKLDMSNTRDESFQQFENHSFNQEVSNSSPKSKFAKNEKANTVNQSPKKGNSVILQARNQQSLVRLQISSLEQHEDDSKREQSESSSDNSSEEEKQTNQISHSVTKTSQFSNSVVQFHNNNNNSIYQDSRTSILSNNGHGINFYQSNINQHGSNHHLGGHFTNESLESPQIVGNQQQNHFQFQQNNGLLAPVAQRASILKKTSPLPPLIIENQSNQDQNQHILPLKTQKLQEQQNNQQSNVQPLQLSVNRVFMARKSQTRRFELINMNKIVEEQAEKSDTSSFKSSSSSSEEDNGDNSSISQHQLSFSQKHQAQSSLQQQQFENIDKQGIPFQSKNSLYPDEKVQGKKINSIMQKKSLFGEALIQAQRKETLKNKNDNNGDNYFDFGGSNNFENLNVNYNGGQKMQGLIEPQSAAVKKLNGSKGVLKSLKSKKRNKKKYKQSQKYQIEKELELDKNFVMPVESQISKQYSNKSTQIVIVLIFITMIGLILLDSTLYQQGDVMSHKMGLKMLQGMYLDEGFTDHYQQAVNFFNETQTSIALPMVYLQCPEIQTWTNQELMQDQRSNEIQTITYGADDALFKMMYITRKQEQVNSIISVGRTVFISIVLMLGSAILTYDAEKLVLAPIERMVEKVKILANDPLAASKQDPKKEGILTKATKLMNMQKKKNNLCHRYFLGSSQQGDENSNETLAIENAITKISSLLALGFGEAGSKYIQKQIKSTAEGAQDDEDGYNLFNGAKGLQQNMVQEIKDVGSDCQKVRALVAFANIRHFQDSTEVMQQKVLLFVNRIAELVHSQVDKYGGCPNRNLGDTFLLVWKAQEYQFKEEGQQNRRLIRKPQSSRAIMSDMALFTVIKIIAKLNSLITFKQYRSDERMKNKVMNYKISMGFGLHYGWAIEGAIGSQFKVDLSYLSPNVNLSSRLCAATQQYGVDILFSQSIHSLLSPNIRELCREVDTVTVKGSKQPIRMFTIDLNTELADQVDVQGNLMASKRRANINIERRMIFKKLLNGSRFSHQIFLSDHDFLEMRSFTKTNWYLQFLKSFRTSYKQYLLGEWHSAQQNLQDCLRYNPTDGPTNSLLHYLEEQNLTPPHGWKGCHALTEK